MQTKLIHTGQLVITNLTFEETTIHYYASETHRLENKINFEINYLWNNFIT